MTSTLKIGFVVIGLLLLSGCSSSSFQSAAQETLNAAAHGVVAADRLAVEAYKTTKQVLEALRATQAQTEEALKIFDFIRSALLYAHESLILADDMLEVYRVSGEAQGFLEAVPQLVQALQSLVQVLQRAGLPIDPQLVSALNAVRMLVQ